MVSCVWFVVEGGNLVLIGQAEAKRAVVASRARHLDDGRLVEPAKPLDLYEEPLHRRSDADRVTAC